MAKKNKATKKGKAGRPTKWDDKYIQMAEIACSRGGFTSSDLAALFDVRESTINNWMNAHPEFREACKRGKETFDTDEVERVLLKAAKGYTSKSVTLERQRLVDKRGNLRFVGDLTETKVVETEVFPNPTCIIFWLKNRRPERWKDKQELDISHKFAQIKERLVEVLAGMEPHVRSAVISALENI